jgi:hypothetical protein
MHGIGLRVSENRTRLDLQRWGNVGADLEMLTRVGNTEDFFRGVLLNDSIADWNLAREFAQYIIRIRPEECGGHFILARAFRHLGEVRRALEELQLCKSLLPGDPLDLPQVEKEEQLLSLE